MRRNRFVQNQDLVRDYLSDFREFVHVFKNGLTQDRQDTQDIQGNNSLNSLPLILWETRDKYFIQTYIAAINDLSRVQSSVKDGHTLILEVSLSFSRPEEGCWFVTGEYPNSLRREISFPHVVKDSSVTLENGVLTIVLEKKIEELKPTLPAIIENRED